MKKYLFFLLLLCSIVRSQSQKQDTLYLFVAKPVISSDLERNYSYILARESSDPRFKYDSYKFSIPNIKDFDTRFQLSEMIIQIKKTKLEDKKLTYVNSLYTEDPYVLHEKFSLAKTLFLVYDNPSDPGYYNILGLIYTGTQKNLLPAANRKM